MKNLKDTITNWIALVIVILTAVSSYLQSSAGQPINWQMLIGGVLVAVIAWFTGKNNDATKKTDSQIEKQLN